MDYDIDNLLEYMVNLCIASRLRVSSQNTDVSGVLGSFLNEHMGNRIVVTHDKRPADKPFNAEMGPANDIGYVTSGLSNGRDLHIRIARAEGLVYISHKSIRDWCVSNGVPREMFDASVVENAFVVSDKKRIELGRLTQWHGTSRVSCLVLQMEDCENI